MTRSDGISIVAAGALALAAALLLAAQEPGKDKAAPREQEREVKQAEVPAAALAALQKLAGDAALTEFAEEIEHGHKFYEGSWKSPDGNVDALVTEAGDVVEIEEIIPAEKVPGAVRALAEKEAGKDTKVVFERKTLFLYELKFKKDGKGREILLTADARRTGEPGEDDDDEDEDD